MLSGWSSVLRTTHKARTSGGVAIRGLGVPGFCGAHAATSRVARIDGVQLAREFVRNRDQVRPQVVHVARVRRRSVHVGKERRVQPGMHGDAMAMRFLDGQREGIEGRVLDDRFSTRFPARIVEGISATAHLHEERVEAVLVRASDHCPDAVGMVQRGPHDPQRADLRWCLDSRARRRRLLWRARRHQQRAHEQGLRSGMHGGPVCGVSRYPRRAGPPTRRTTSSRSSCSARPVLVHSPTDPAFPDAIGVDVPEKCTAIATVSALSLLNCARKMA